MKWKHTANGIRWVRGRVAEGLRRIGVIDRGDAAFGKSRFHGSVPVEPQPLREERERSAAVEDPVYDVVRDAAIFREPKEAKILRIPDGQKSLSHRAEEGADTETIGGRETTAGDAQRLSEAPSTAAPPEEKRPPKKQASLEKLEKKDVSEKKDPLTKSVSPTEKGPPAAANDISSEAFRPEKSPDPDGVPAASGETAIRPKLVMMLRSDTIEAECFKLFRSLLSLAGSAPSPRSILCAGVAPGQVMMVDCDLSKPDLKNLMGAGSLTDIWAHSSGDAPSASMPTEAHDRARPHRAWLSRSRQPGQTLDELAAPYDERTVLYDSPPPAAANRAGYGDGALMVLDYGILPHERVRSLLDRIGRDRILGCIRSRQTRKELHLGNQRAASMMP